MRIEDLLLNEESRKRFCCIDSEKEWTGDSLLKRVYKLRDDFKALGVEHSDRIIVYTENGSAFIVGILAAMLAGGIAVPVDPQIPYDAVINIVKRVEAKTIFINGVRPEKNFSNHSEDTSKVKVLKEDLDENYEIKESQDFTKYEDENEPAFILFSSGTTGIPKGVIQTHKSILTNLDAIIDYMKPNENDIFYISKTMVHSSTLTGELLVALKLGLKLIALNPLVSPKTLLKRFDEYKPTIVCVNPTILRLILRCKNDNYDLTSIQRIYTSGAVADKDLLVKVKEKISTAKLLNVYGLTEAGPRLTAQTEDRFDKFGSVGKSIKGVKIYVYNDENQLCKSGEIGEVYVETSSLMVGYWKNQEATKEKIVGNKLRTGDLGYLDEEGNLFIIGRADDMIIRGGHNVDPNHVESVIRKCQGIDNCIVFGVEDKLNGNKLICGYTKKDHEDIDKNKILEECSKVLALYECPQEFCMFDRMPTTATGKVSRRLAVEKYKEL